MRSVRRVVVAAVLAFAPPLAFAFAHVGLARAQTDLKTNTDTTTKDGTGGASTGKELSTGKDLDTGGGKPKPKSTAVTTTTASETTSASEGESAAPTESASAAPSTSSSFQPFTRRNVEVGVGDFEIAVGAPAGWPEMGDDDLPTVDLSAAPEASIAVRRGFGWHKPDAKTPKVAEVVVVCAKAPVDAWGDGIRDGVFTSMIQGVEKEAQEFTDLKSLDPDPIHTEGDRIVQPFHAWANFTHDGEKADITPAGEDGKSSKAAPTRVQLQGLSFVGFKAEAGDARTLVACTVACANLVAQGEKGICPDVVQSLEVSGTFATAPKRSWIADMIFAFKKDKTTGILVLVGGVVALVLVGVLVAMLFRKKKPEATATPSGVHEAAEDEEFQAGYEAGLAAARAASSSASPSLQGAPAPGGASGSIAATMQEPSPSTSGSPLHASPPPPQGYFDPTTLQPR